MADPLSISAAVVQFLEISVHLCMKLHSFCAEMRDVPEKLGSLETEITQQIRIAEDIRSSVSGISPALKPSSITLLREILDDYSSKMDQLLRILESVSCAPHNGLLKRSWNALRALDKKTEILLCCDQLAQKKSLLSIWFGNTNIHLSSQVKEIVEEGINRTASLSRQLEVNSIKTDAHQKELSRVLHATEDTSQEILVLATQQFTDQKEILAAVHQTSSETRNEIRSLAGDWQSLGTTLREFRDVLNENQELSSVILRAASNRNSTSTWPEQYAADDISQRIREVHLCDIQNNSPKIKSIGGIATAPCTCRAFSQLNYRECLTMLHFKSVFRKRHYSRCPRAKASDESLEFTMKIIPPTWLLSHTIHLSLVLRNWNNGRPFSIAPVVIGTSRIVDINTSPGFQTVRRYEELLESDRFQNSTVFVESLEKSLKDVLSAGQSSALDEDRDGNTLLYEILRLYLRHERCGLSHKTTYAPGFLSLVQFLLDNGSNPNAICSHSTSYIGAGQGTALDLFAGQLLNPRPMLHRVVNGEIEKSLIEKLNKEGAEFSKPLRTATESNSHFRSQLFEKELGELRSFPEQIEVCEYNDLVPAILERDELRLQKALARCETKHQSAATGLSPMHFAVTWPLALRALVEMGADVNVEDHIHRRPIHLAVALGNTEAVDMLLEADCAVWTHNHSLLLLQEALQGKDKGNRERVANSVITAYIDRYTRFFNLALSVLPQSSPILSKIVPGRLHERFVPQITQELRRHLCHIPPALELVSGGSGVYETADLHASNRLTVQMAERLWEGGFQQIHEHYVGRGTTPLLEAWYNADFEMISWFVSKGASPLSRHAQTHGSGLHLYANRLGYPGAYFSHSISAVPYDAAIVSQLESDPDSKRDSCCCLCSVGGCTPVVVFLKSDIHLNEIRFYGSRGSAYQTYSTQLRLFWKKLPPLPDEEGTHMDVVLRFLVFERMNLKHNCCSLGHMAGINSKITHVSDEDMHVLESKRELEAAMRMYRDKMRSCNCQLLEKPLCVVLRDNCEIL